MRAEYERRLAARRAVAERAEALARRISNARLAVFAAGVALAVLAFAAERVTPHVLWIPLVAFVALVVWHDRALRRRADARRAVAWYEDGLARLEARFAGRGVSGERLRDPHHPYAEDLDLFGRGSLFELLCRARTRAGEDTLARWLLGPAPPDVVRARQAAVAELAPAFDLRERLAVVGAEVAAGLHADALVAWGEAAPPAPPTALRAVAAALSLLSAGLVAGIALGAPLLVPWLFVLAIEAGFAASVRRRVRATLAHIDAPVRDLDLLARLLAVLEEAELRAPRLAALRAAIAADGAASGATASRAIERLDRLAQLLDARRNQLFAPIGAALLFTTQVAFAIDAWRARHGRALRAWVDAVAELEALASLAGHAAEHPGDAWPELVPGPPCFDAEGATHPLLPEERAVRNDVRLDADTRVLLVSGSNMSGKSTLLRTVGTNAVLALAGAPVRATRLRLSPLSVGASIHVRDSLQEGHSRFYAEIQRLRQIVDLTRGERPVLFLLDEILHGTNSHDRRLGAEAVVRSLVERGAIGLVTTHDLALAQLADTPGLGAVNVHFEDTLEDGRIRFDYRMRPGVVTRSNAIALMRAVGLEV